MALIATGGIASMAVGCSTADDGAQADESAREEEPASAEDDGDDAVTAPTRDGGARMDAGSARDAGTRMRDGGVTADDGGTTTGDGGGTQALACDGKPLPPRARAKQPPFAVGPEAAGLPAYWPTSGWRSETPAKLGFDPHKLEQALALKTPYTNTQALMVIRHGYVAAEQYFGGFTATTRHESYSMAKSYTSALVGIAIDEGKLASTNERVCSAYPEQWRCDDATDARSRITVDHAMNLMTGLQWQEDWRSTATGRNDAYAFNMLDTVLARKATEEPGIRRRYSTGDPALLSGVLQKATGMTVYRYAKEKLFDVIGTPDVRWNSDSKGRTTSYAGLQATARDYAKLGYLYLQKGRWDGKQVVPAAWVDKTTRAEKPCEDWNRYLWHQNLHVRLGTQDPACDGIFCAPTELADLPPDGFFAEGVNGQFVFVIPSADLVVVRLAADMPGSERWDDYARGFLTALLDAVRD